jgi:phosphoglycerate dehydrogenase-like enzyme
MQNLSPTPALLILDKDAESYHTYLRHSGIDAVTVLECRDPQSLPRGAESAELALGPPDLLVQALPHLPNLHWAQSTWAGVEPLLEPGVRRNYLLSAAKGVFGSQMAEYCLCYMLAHERGVIVRARSQAQGQWQHDKPGRLAGKHAVMLGLGSIGSEIALRCRQFGMSTTGVNRSGDTNRIVDRCFPVAELEQAVLTADYLILSLPGTTATRHIVNARVLSRLPAHCVIINVGRGQSIDESALDAALRSGKLGGAVLDVFENEPLPAGHFLWTTPRLHITSHTAAVSHVQDIAPLLVSNLGRLLQGQEPEFLIDWEKGY